MHTSTQHLSTYLSVMPVVSVHEHHQPDEWFAGFDLDKLFSASYVGWINPFRGPITDREVFLDHVRLNAYFVWAERGIRAVHGVGAITVQSWDAVSATIRAAQAGNSRLHIDCLREVGRYRRAIQDAYWAPGSNNGHAEIFSPTFRVNSLILCHHPEMVDHNGNSLGTSFTEIPASFDDFLLAVDRLIGERKAGGAVALKSALAYDRDIAYQPVERRDAARVYGRHPAEVSPAEARAYQDFMHDYLCALAGKYELPFQQHTGLAKLAGSNPLHLEPTIARHPGTKFVLFHGGYPWVGEVAALAHNYPNVYPDLTWLPIISPTAAIRAIREWLEVAPSGRSICWGGDCQTGEESVGAALAFKHTLAIALGQLVDEGYLSMPDAERAAQNLCYANAEALYGLS